MSVHNGTKPSRVGARSLQPGESVDASSFICSTPKMLIGAFQKRGFLKYQTNTCFQVLKVHEICILGQKAQVVHKSVPRAFWFELSSARSPMEQSPTQPCPPTGRTHRTFLHNAVLPV